MNKAMFCAIIFGIFSLIVPLTGCSEKVSQQSAITAEALLGTLETAGFQYEQGDFGTPDPAVVNEIKALDQIAYTDMKQIRDAAASGTTLKTSEKVAAVAAVTALEAYLVKENILPSTMNVTTDSIISSSNTTSTK